MGYDLWVGKIDAELSNVFLWDVQNGTVACNKPSALVIDDNGTVYIVGTTSDTLGVLCEF